MRFEDLNDIEWRFVLPDQTPQRGGARQPLAGE